MFCRPLRRVLNRESQAQQDVKSTEWYALRRHNLRIHTWHTAAPPYCTCSKLEFALGCYSTDGYLTLMQTGFGPLVSAGPSRTAGLPQGEKPPRRNSSLENMQPLLPGVPADLTRLEDADSTKPPPPIMMRAAMNQDQGRRKPTWRLRRLLNHRQPRSSPVPTWRICRR